MASLDEVLAAVAEQTTVVNGLAIVINDLEAQILAELGGQITPEQQAKIDAIFAGVNANKDAVAAAILDGTDGTAT